MSKLLLTFAVWTTTLRSEQVTEILGLRPDTVVVKGSDRTPPKLRPPANGWFIDAMDSDGDDPVALLGQLLGRVQELPLRLQTLRSVDPSTDVTISLSVTPFSARMPFYFPSSMIDVISALGANFDLEFFESSEL